MSNAIIYVFSGTRNTLLTAKLIKSSLELRNVETTIYEVTKPFDDVPSSALFDFVGFMYPVHAFNCPEVFYRFVQQLPGAKRKAFIIKTSGEPFKLNDASSYKLYKALKKKGFDLVQERHLLMPYNIMFRYKDSLAKQMLQTNQALSELFVKQLLSGERRRIPYSLRHRLISVIFRIIWPAAKLNGYLYSVNKKTCTNCMKCVKECPTKNISFSDGKFHFSGSCAMCMRCTMFCPTNAVNPGILKFWKVNGAYEFERLLGDPDIPSDFINEDTKGYFKLFRKYYRNAQQELVKYGQTLSKPPAAIDAVIEADAALQAEDQQIEYQKMLDTTKAP